MAESIRITLVALFFFRMCVGGGLADEIGFDTLLAAAIMMIQFKYNIKGFSLKSRTLLSKNKVRDSDITSVYARSSFVLQPVP